MKILVATNLYPTTKRPFISPFVKEQVQALRDGFPDLAIDVRVIEGDRPRWPYLREMLVLPLVASKGRYDIVHVHFGLALISTLFVQVPVVVTFHGSDLLLNPTKHISRWLGPRTAKAIVVSRKLKDKLGYGEVIPCGIDVKSFALPDYRINKQTPRLPGKIKILFPSSPTNKIKDYGLFQTVCEELENRGNEVERVHLVNIERDKVREIYWDCDIMLLTSLSEGSPTVIKEAIAAQLPFVSVNVGDVEEWANRVDFGQVVVGRNAITLADAVISLLSRIKSRHVLDNTKCIELMDLSSIARRIKGIYDQVLAVRQ